MKIFDYLRVVRGGTGLNTIVAGGILYATALDILNRLAPTAANQVLRSTAANALQFAALVVGDLPAHAASHEDTGVDEISVAGLSGLLADDQHVLDAEVLLVAAALVHAARHQNGGADEINVADLSGLLADDQHVLDAEVLLVAAALVHESRHVSGGADEIDSALGIAAMADLSSTKIWQGNVGNRPVEVALPAAGANATSGSYTGDDGNNKAIAHGLGVIPKLVMIVNESDKDYWHRILDSDNGYIYGFNSTGSASYRFAVTSMTTTNFYVGNDTDIRGSANRTAEAYHWIAIG